MKVVFILFIASLLMNRVYNAVKGAIRKEGLEEEIKMPLIEKFYFLYSMFEISTLVSSVYLYFIGFPTNYIMTSFYRMFVCMCFVVTVYYFFKSFSKLKLISDIRKSMNIILNSTFVFIISAALIVYAVYIV